MHPVVPPHYVLLAVWASKAKLPPPENAFVSSWCNVLCKAVPCRGLTGLIMVLEVKAKSWEHLLAELFANDWREDIGRHRSRYAFRGMTKDWPTMPTSLMRLGGNFAELEKHLLRNFRKYAHRDVVERETFWHWLTVGQHHGLPTRLLDWTYSPFVALHFATSDVARMGDDAVVWAIDIDDAHNKLPKPLKASLDAEGASVFTTELLDVFALPDASVSVMGFSASVSEFRKLEIKSLEDLDRFSKKPFCLFLEPPSLDDRVVNQFALFSIINDPQISMDQWILKSGVSCKKIIIPKELKWLVRDRLDQSNISERTLFPGLAGLSDWLKRHYSPI
ncbi:MAG: FRG domain-containing protein [Pseudomonadota bacterium]